MGSSTDLYCENGYCRMTDVYSMTLATGVPISVGLTSGPKSISNGTSTETVYPANFTLWLELDPGMVYVAPQFEKVSPDYYCFFEYREKVNCEHLCSGGLGHVYSHLPCMAADLLWGPPMYRDAEGDHTGGYYARCIYYAADRDWETKKQ